MLVYVPDFRMSASGISYARELRSAVTAFRRSALFLDMQISELAAGGPVYADFVGLGVVWLPSPL